jgi:precorrin-6Y C5,15-methyltransferase (decarboxylating)
VLLASGDPGFFGILRLLNAHGLAPEVLPAVSAVAAAFARAGRSWDDALVLSAHGRELRRVVNACRAHPAVAVLTGPGAGPAELGEELGGADRRLVIFERIFEPTERISECSPAEAAGRAWAEPNLVLVLAGGTPARGWAFPRRQVPEAWAAPVDEFAHRDGMITKPEVRALALARLGPGLGDLVWDVGSGSGSVAVEAAAFGAAVIAVERDEAAGARIVRNAAAHRVEVTLVRGNAPECLAGLPDPDAVFVGGGGPEVTAAAARRAGRVVVVALAALDRLAPVRAALAGAGLRVGGSLLSAAALAELPDGGLRFAAANPVAVLWGER